MRLLLAIILFAGLANAQVQQSQFTTNKLSSSTGLTNVVTSTNAYGVKSYDVRLDVAGGAGITLTTNGTQITVSVAGAGLGDVSGPASATNLAVAIFDGASGKQIKDGGVTLSTLLSVGAPANTVVGPGTAVTSGRLASWSGTSGTNIADSGYSASSFATSGHTHAQLHDRAHGVTSASDHSDWPASVDLTELGYLDGVTSGIQSQLNGKQASGAYLTESSASLLYQGTNANLTLWQALAPSSKQDTDADLATWAGITPGANVGTFLATPSSANLRSAITDENGTGALLFDGAGSITMGTATFAGLNVTNLTASQAVVTDASKNLASLAYTGAGNVMRTRVGVYRNVWITPSAMNTAASGGPAFANNTWATTTDGQSLECYDFDASTDESVQFTYTFPDAWDAGTLKAKFFWKQVAASAATNVWGIVAGSIGDNETGGNTLGSAVTVEDVGLNDTNKVAITAATAAITVGGTPSAGHIVWFKVYRDADASADNMSGDARLIGVQLQYTETTTEPSAW